MSPDEGDARVQKALAEARYVQEFVSKHYAEVVLAGEVVRLTNVQQRIRMMIKSWRDIAAEQRALALEWRSQGETLAWHAIRLDTRAEILEVQALLLESILTTR